VKFGVLGPYLIFPGHQHRIRAAKHRSLLAILTINANTFVSVDRLADELWLGEPPMSASNLIRQYVSAIRRQLPERPDSSLITTMPAGYRLRLEPGDLDRDEFDRLFDLGQRAMASGHAEPTAEALSEALAKWRGDPLADVERSPSIAAEARRLDERRLSAIEMRIQAELRRGRHAGVVDELAALVTLYPQRERLRAQQMQALYATGRRADALATFREGRNALVDAAGIEPGPELQHLHRQVLTGDLPVEPLAGHITAQVGDPRPRRRLAPLPVDVPDMVDRDGEMAFIESTVDQSVRSGHGVAAAPVVVISGKAGVGKSVLAVRVAHRLSARFPDGQLFLPMGELTVEQALDRAVRALGAPAVDPPPDELPAVYRTWSRGRRVLIVLDDAPSEQHVRPLIPAGSQSAVLVTSRSLLAGIEGGQHLVCAPLGQAAAVQMMTGIIGHERAEAELDAVRALVDRLGRLPLALRIAGAILVLHRDWPVGLLLGRLASRNIVDELSHGDLALRPRLAASYERLSEVERQVFRRVGVLPRSPFDIEAAAAVAEFDADAVERAVDRLLDLHLLEAAGTAGDGQPLFAMDDLASAYAIDLVKQEAADVIARLRRRVPAVSAH
jgi:DNA-binding SARP family transcriptional activator